MIIPHFAYPLTPSWVFESFPPFGCYERGRVNPLLSGDFCGNGRSRGGPADSGSYPQHHSLTSMSLRSRGSRLQLCSEVGPPTGLDGGSLQDYGPRCLAWERIPHRCLFTHCSLRAVRQEAPTAAGSRGPPLKNTPLCLSFPFGKTQRFH